MVPYSFSSYSIRYMIIILVLHDYHGIQPLTGAGKSQILDPKPKLQILNPKLQTLKKPKLAARGRFE